MNQKIKEGYKMLGARKKARKGNQKESLWKCKFKERIVRLDLKIHVKI